MCEGKKGHFDRFLSLPTTSPLRESQDIRAALRLLDKSGVDICITVTPSARSPYFNMVRFYDEELVEIVTTHDQEVSRRQDAPLVYDITTVAYVTSPAFVMNSQSIFSGRVGAVTVPKNRAVDIDDIYDFIFAEAILERGALSGPD